MSEGRRIEPWNEWIGKDHMRNPYQLKHPVRRRIVEEVSKTGNTVLEVGCATAIDSPLFKAAGIEYTGIDISDKLISRARFWNPKINVQWGDAYDIQFPDHSYDAVYCKDLIEHLPPEYYKTVIKEMWRVAKKMMLISSYISFVPETTKYKQHQCGFYVNSHGVKEITEVLENLKGFKTLDIIDMKVSWTPCTLIIVRK